MDLILSIFPGIDLLGMAFEQVGFCIVRGPDLITGGDIRDFSPPGGVFGGIIGGPPCQDFSGLNRSPGTYSYEMMGEFTRVVEQAAPKWFLCENVSGFPAPAVLGYDLQRFSLDLSWFSPFSRRREFVFGTPEQSIIKLNPMIKTTGKSAGGAVTGSDQRSFRACCDIQGLPSYFDIPFFTLSGKKQAVANGVPLSMGRYMARLIQSTIYHIDPPDLSKLGRPDSDSRYCKCGCGRVVVGRAKHANATCRKRAQRNRQKKVHP